MCFAIARARNGGYRVEINGIVIARTRTFDGYTDDGCGSCIVAPGDILKGFKDPASEEFAYAEAYFVPFK